MFSKSFKLLRNLKIKPNFAIACRYFETLDAIRIDRHYIKDFQDLKTTDLLPQAKYGGENLVTLIVGNNKRSERSAEYITKAFTILNAPIMFEPISAETCCEDNKPVPNTKNIVLSMLRNRYGLSFDQYLTPQKKIERHRITRELGLYASVSHCFSVPGFKNKWDKLDLVMIIQNGRSLMEYEPVKGVIETLRIMAYKEMYSFVKYAYEYAKKHKRRKITFLHNETYFTKSDGLTFLKAIEDLKGNYCEIETETDFADNVARNLIRRPHILDVICCEDRFGTVLAIIAASLCGGPSLFGVCNMGKHHGFFQPLENRLSILIKDDEPSPYSIFTAGIQMLSQIGHCKHAEALWKALLETMMSGYKTAAFGGSCTADTVAFQVMSRLSNIPLGGK